jgi:O-antigen/teichoic acid export membrane protein
MFGIDVIKKWLGPLWWYTLILFCVQRAGDAINAFVGLYLVPKYVPQAELGAVLPLSQVGLALGLPLAFLAAPFTKYLNTYATRGEFGKVKSLLRDAFVLHAVVFGFMILYAQFFMPMVFERMRVQDGRLRMLVVMYGVIGALAPIFSSALQALKKFRLMAVLGFFASPIRLATMLVCMPIRALSGYFVGQIVPTLCGIVVALFSLRHLMGRGVKSEPYLNSDWKPMLQYALSASAIVVTGVLQGTVEGFVIRHRLPDVESAGYYMISRFAEIGAYGGVTISMVMFPLVAERHERGDNPIRLLWETMAGSLGFGALLACAFHFFGADILGLLPAWRDYVLYAPQMVLLTLIYAVRVAFCCFTNYEMACHRFSFVWYVATAVVVECVLLYGLTGYSFFAPWLPSSAIHWMASLRAARLSFILQVMMWTTIVPVVGMLIHLTTRHVRCRNMRNTA